MVNHLGDKSSQDAYRSLQDEAGSNAPLTAVAGDIGSKKVGQAIVDEAVSSFGGLDAFVANAGVSLFRDFLTYVYTTTPSRDLQTKATTGWKKMCSTRTCTRTSRAHSGQHKRLLSKWSSKAEEAVSSASRPSAHTSVASNKSTTRQQKPLFSR